MDLNFILQMYIPIVLVACLAVGYVIKKWIPADNKWIPTIMLVLGAVLGCIANKCISMDSIVAGAVTGLASTGLHQAFTQIIDNKKIPVIAEKDMIDEATVHLAAEDQGKENQGVEKNA